MNTLIVVLIVLGVGYMISRTDGAKANGSGANAHRSVSNNTVRPDCPIRSEEKPVIVPGPSNKSEHAFDATYTFQDVWNLVGTLYSAHYDNGQHIDSTEVLYIYEKRLHPVSNAKVNGYKYYVKRLNGKTIMLPNHERLVNGSLVRLCGFKHPFIVSRR